MSEFEVLFLVMIAVTGSIGLTCYGNGYARGRDEAFRDMSKKFRSKK